MNTTAQTIGQFIERVGLGMSFSQFRSRKGWDANMRHFHCIINRHGESGTMKIDFSMGSGLKGDPTLTSVLDCLAGDLSDLANHLSFEEWAAEYGYDPDSRKAEAIYKAIEQQREDISQILSDSEVEDLMWNTERE